MVENEVVDANTAKAFAAKLISKESQTDPI